jgi:transcriptional regulator with XRE-family HTH domain
MPGPGTELKQLLISIGITPKFDCNCESLLREMNQLGVDGCRRDRERLVASLRANAHHYTWLDRLRAARRVAQSELALRIDLVDPIGWLFDEAVRRYANKSRGPGAVLLKLIASKGYQIPLSDKIQKVLYNMNQWGPAWVREHIDDITEFIVEQWQDLYPQEAKEFGEDAMLVFSRRLVLQACRDWDRGI